LSFAPPAALDHVRFDQSTADHWRQMPNWLGNPSARASLSVAEGCLAFSVPEPNKGMKWTVAARPTDARYLLVRYRAVNLRPSGDYFIYLDDGLRHDLPFRGLNAIRLNQLVADGRWHFVAADLAARKVGPFITTVAVHVQANERGEARLWVEEIAFVDKLPPGCQVAGERPPPGPARSREIPLATLAEARAEPSWLSNPASPGAFGLSLEKANRKDRRGAVRFRVAEAGNGMKWSGALRPPLDLSATPFLLLRYKAVGLAPRRDYLIYLGPQKPARAQSYYHAVWLDEVVADGKWHTLVVRSKPYRASVLAIQVQARSRDATLWLAPLVFSSRRPEIALGLRDLLTFSTDLVKARVRPPDARLLDISPALNHSLADHLSTLGLAADARFPAKNIVVAGIPFRVSTSTEPNVAVCPPGARAVEIPIGERASEVFLLLSLRLPLMDEPSYGGGRRWRITRPHRVRVEVEYEDGAVDRCLPYRLAAAAHEVARGLDAYCVAADPARRIRAVRVCDGLAVGSVGLCGLTLKRSGRRLFPRSARIPPAVATKRVRLPDPGEPKAELSGGRAVVGNACLRLALALDRGVVAEKLEVAPLRANVLACPAPLFEVQVGDERVGSGDYRLDEGRTEGAALLLKLRPPRADLPSLELTLRASRSPALSLAARAVNTARNALRPRLRLLSAVPMRLGEGDRYFFPANPPLLSDEPTNLGAIYGGAFPLQFVSLFNYQAGCGLYAMTRDTEGQFKRFLVRRSRSGTTALGVEFWPDPLPPGASFATPALLLGVNTGDWHGAFAAYKEWARSWYRPLVARKRWFRQVFFFRQDYIRAGLLDPKTRTYRLREKVREAREAFGGCDFLHIFDWGACGRRGRTGDYDPWGQIIPGPREFAEAVAALQREGIPVGLYIEGYLVDRRSRVGAKHCELWGMRNARAELMPFTPGSSELIMCPMVKAWQDYLAATYKRVCPQTGASGFYIDEFGFLTRFCHATDHGHPSPCHVCRGEAELTRRVRLAVSPESVVYTEETPCDVNSQFQDGSFTYCVRRGQVSSLEVPLKLFRFAFPDFKTFEIIACDRPTGSNVEAVKQVFFNGEGLWLQGEPNAWFTPATLQAIRKCMGLLREHRAAFTSDDVEPLVPTLVGGVFANRFRAPDETVWTLYNANPLTVRGPVLSVRHEPRARYLDLWNARELEPRVADGEAVISLEIGPHDVGMVARSRRKAR